MMVDRLDEEARAPAGDAELRERMATAIDGARMWALVAGINADDADKRRTEALAMADAVLAALAPRLNGASPSGDACDAWESR